MLLDHPAVRDAAVCGIEVPSEATEYPIAYVELKDPTVSSERRRQVVASIRNHVDDRVAYYKRLKGGIEVLEKIPRK